MNKYLVFFLVSLVASTGLVIHSAQGQTCGSIADEDARKACIDSQWEARGLDPRNAQRDTEVLSRQLERAKEIDLRLEERYYTDIVRQVDATSIDIYAAFMPVVSRIAEVESRARNIVYNRLPDAGIALTPTPNRPLPEGISFFDVEEKFMNAQNCLDGRHFSDGTASWPQMAGNCWLYDVPASGVSPNPNGIQRLPAPSIIGGIIGWPNFTSNLSVLAGAFNVGFGTGGGGGWTPPISWLTFLPPPFLPDGVQLTANGNLVEYYSPGSPQIVTGYASQCMRDVPARYFPEYYPPAANMTAAEISQIPLSETIGTPCDLIDLGEQAITNLLTDVFNSIFGTNLTALNTLPFPEYEALAGNLAIIASLPFFQNQISFAAIDHCAPLECVFPDEAPFNFMVNVERNVYKSHVQDMRRDLEVVRQAYRALYFDLTQALAYHEYYLRQE